MSRKILIVEDEGILRVGTTLQLMSLGFEVVGHFQTGEEAVDNVVDLNPDLILMDIQLAGKMNGIETVREIQKKIDVPVVYLSAYSSHELIEEAETTKPFRYLVKPLDEMELKFTIETAIDTYQRQKRVEIKDEVLDNLHGLLYRFFVKDKKVNFINGSSESIIGLSERELTDFEGHFLEQFIIEEDQENVLNTMNNSLNSKVSFRMNYRIRNNNKINYFHEMGQPVYGDEGEITHIDGIIFDLNTEH
jgi:two-component system, response regulator PdtaR